MKQIPSLRPGFNNVSVKKGDTFKIELFEGGMAGASNDVNIVAGKATLVSSDLSEEGLDCSGARRTFTFKAEEAGDVEVMAQATYRLNGSKDAPVSFKLKVQ